MIAGETILDHCDAFLHSHVGHWISLKWRGDLFPPPQGKAYGSHLAAFILCPYGTEIRGLNYCWLYSDGNGRIFRVGVPLAGIAATWFFKYSTLKNFHAESLSAQDIDFLELPDFDTSMHADLTQAIRALRSEERLHPFRHPGFPDDVSVTCGASYDVPDKGFKMGSEQVWIRLTGRDSDCRFTGTMLNQPAFYEWRKGSQVAVHLIQTNDRDMLVCGKIT